MSLLDTRIESERIASKNPNMVINERGNARQVIVIDFWLYAEQVIQGTIKIVGIPVDNQVQNQAQRSEPAPSPNLPRMCLE